MFVDHFETVDVGDYFKSWIIQVLRIMEVCWRIVPLVELWSVTDCFMFEWKHPEKPWTTNLEFLRLIFLLTRKSSVFWKSTRFSENKTYHLTLSMVELQTFSLCGKRLILIAQDHTVEALHELRWDHQRHSHVDGAWFRVIVGWSPTFVLQ